MKTSCLALIASLCLLAGCQTPVPQPTPVAPVVQPGPAPLRPPDLVPVDNSWDTPENEDVTWTQLYFEHEDGTTWEQGLHADGREVWRQVEWW